MSEGTKTMTCSYQALCDDFYVSVRVGLKLDLAYNRETFLHFFEQVGKCFPGMCKMHRCEDQAIVLEEDRDEHSHRWLRIERDCLRFGHFNPPDLAGLNRLAEFVLEHAPYHLSLSTIDLDVLELVFGFDLEYEGNQDEVVVDALLGDHPLAVLLNDAGHTPLEFQPNFGIALDEGCSRQAYFEVKTRTSAYAVRSKEYDKDPLSVYMTLQQYWGADGSLALGPAYADLMALAEELADGHVVPLLLAPLTRTIASRR